MALTIYKDQPGDGVTVAQIIRRMSTVDHFGAETEGGLLQIGTDSAITKVKQDDPMTSGWLYHGWQSGLSNRTYDYDEWGNWHLNGDLWMQYFESFMEFTAVTKPPNTLLAAGFMNVVFADNTATRWDAGNDQWTYTSNVAQVFHEYGQRHQSLCLQSYDWGGGVQSGDEWYNIASVEGRTMRGFAYKLTQAKGTGHVQVLLGSDALHDELAAASEATLRYTMFTDYMAHRFWGLDRNHSAPYWLSVWSGSNLSDTNHERAPQLCFYTIPNSHLAQVLGASVQLSDGTHVFLEFNPNTRAITLKHRASPTASATTIATLPTGILGSQFRLMDSAQSFDICRDNNDNIYVIGPRGDTPRAVAGCAYIKGPGYTWTFTAVRSFMGPEFTGGFNNFVCNWVPGMDGSRPNGVIWISAAHRVGYNINDGTSPKPLDFQGNYKQFINYTVNAKFFIDGSVTAKIDEMSQDGWNKTQWWSRNGLGNGLDLLVPSNDKGVYVTFDNSGFTDVNGDTKASINLLGVAPDPADMFNWNYPLGNSPLIQGAQRNDSEGKIRVVDMWSSTRIAYCYNGQIAVRDTVAASSTFGSVDLTTQGIAGFPSKAVIAKSSAWDIWYDRSTARFWIYYVDSQNPRRILCVGYDNVAGTIINKTTPRVVATNIGASGSSIVAIRIPRKRIDERWVHIDVASIGVDGVQTLTYVEDTAQNIAPNTPVIQDVVAFPHTANGPIKWTFTDPNANDYQKKYELQVKRVSDGTTVYNPGPITSTNISGKPPANGAVVTENIPANTLTSNTLYQVRVRLYDSNENISGWSDWKTFGTSGNGGTVSIIDPPGDTDVNGSSVSVTWVFTPNATSNSPQASYRVKVYRVSDNALLQDSGVISTTDTTRVVSNLVTDIAQRIEVIVTDVAGQPSSPGIRVVTPMFGRPPQPQITVQPSGPFIRVSVTNPVPGTDQSQVIRNEVYRREIGESDWIKIGETVVDGVYDDYAVASDILYDYKVIGVS